MIVGTPIITRLATITINTLTPFPRSTRGQSGVVDILTDVDSRHGDIFVRPVHQVIGPVFFNFVIITIIIAIIS